MAHTNTPSSCPAGGAHSPSVRYSLDDAPRCTGDGCSVLLLAVVSIDAGLCAVCRLKARSALTLVQLQHLVAELEAKARRREAIGGFEAAADFFLEARLVDVVIAHRIEVAHG